MVFKEELYKLLEAIDVSDPTNCPKWSIVFYPRKKPIPLWDCLQYTINEYGKELQNKNGKIVITSDWEYKLTIFENGDLLIDDDNMICGVPISDIHVMGGKASLESECGVCLTFTFIVDGVNLLSKDPQNNSVPETDETADNQTSHPLSVTAYPPLLTTYDPDNIGRWADAKFLDIVATDKGPGLLYKIELWNNYNAKSCYFLIATDEELQTLKANVIKFWEKYVIPKFKKG